jgi:hypothetical protein
MNRLPTIIICLFALHFFTNAQVALWRRAEGTEKLPIFGLDLYRKNPDTLYSSGLRRVALYNVHDLFMRSTNRGETWDSVFRSPTIAEPGAIYVDPENSQILYIMVPNLTGGNDLLKSTNGGATWKTLFDNPTFPSYVFEIDPLHPNIMYTWSGALSRSTDRGETWAVLSGIDAGYAMSLAIAPSNDSVLYVIGYSGDSCFKSIDMGTSWSRLPVTFLKYSPHTEVIVDPRNPDIVYLTAATYATGAGSIYISSDGGFAWKSIRNGLPSKDGFLNYLTINSKNPTELYLTTGIAPDQFGSVVLKSTDRGESWQPFNVGLPESCAAGAFLIDTMNNRLYVGISDTDSSGVYIYDGLTTVENNKHNNPENFKLQANYPNPFNPVTTIGYEIAHRADVTLSIFDLSGKQVTLIRQGNQEAGQYHILWDARGLSSGVYLIQLNAGKVIRTGKALLIK